MTRRRRIYEGKAKVLFEGPEPGTLVQYFKDDATAFNNQKKGTITGKGVLNNRISEFLMLEIAEIGIPTHFVRRLNMREQLVRQVEIIPIEVVVRNVVAGSLAKRLGIAEGTKLARSIVEYYYKNDALDDPMINQWHITVLGMATEAELKTLSDMALKINGILRSFLETREILLVDGKLEFGRHHGKILLGDEICPDTCRFWDATTRKKLDKDRFRQDLGGVEEAYHEVHRRVCTAA